MATTKRLGEVHTQRDTIVLDGAAAATPRGTLVKGAGAQREAIKCSASTDTPRGVTTFDLVAGETGTIVTDGQVLAIAGEVIAVDIDLTSDSDGRCVAAAEGDKVMGRSLEPATAEDQLFLIEFFKSGPYVPA